MISKSGTGLRPVAMAGPDRKRADLTDSAPNGDPPAGGTAALPPRGAESPSSASEVTNDLVADMQELIRYFHHHGDWIGWAGINALPLFHTPQTLCRLGILRPKRLGRWDEGWAPGECLTDL